MRRLVVVLLCGLVWSCGTDEDRSARGVEPAGVYTVAHAPWAAEHRCLATTLYFEARSEGREGMVGVGWVVLNRLADTRFPDTICDVVQQGGETPGCQFSYWCDGLGDTPAPGEQWQQAQRIAGELIGRPPADPTRGALFFHQATLPAVPWAVPRERTVQIGNHIYYR